MPARDLAAEDRLMSLLTRRTALARIGGALVAAPLGTRLLGGPALAQEERPAGPGSDRFHSFSLAGPGPDGPLPVGRTMSHYGGEIGHSKFEDESYVMHLSYPGQGLRRQDWLGRRIGQFSIKDGALMVDAVGELNETGCFALEMRHQAYKDRRYIRSNWLSIDPPTGMVTIGADGIWSEMENVAKADGVSAVRPQGEWNTFLFIARGSHLEGWVNGVKAIEGENDQFGSGRVSLIVMRMDEAPYRVRFRNLRVWDGVLPDPTTVWG
jgi:hypothetical protein